MLNRSTPVLQWLKSGTGPLPRTAVVVAHPDDETIGAGGRLKRLARSNFIYVTDGAPYGLSDARAAGMSNREDYRVARKQELNTVLGLAGINSNQVRCLGCIDQQASFAMLHLTMTLYELLQNLDSELVLTHPYEGGHPDHDTTALAVHGACRLIERRYGKAPLIVEMASYHNRARIMETGSFLPDYETCTVTAVLSGEERRFKEQLFGCYRSQARVLQSFQLEFERFRVAPLYDFTRPPHCGRLYYESYDWGITGEGWRKLADDCWGKLALS